MVPNLNRNASQNLYLALTREILCMETSAGTRIILSNALLFKVGAIYAISLSSDESKNTQGRLNNGLRTNIFNSTWPRVFAIF